jgi:hypothetical protein
MGQSALRNADVVSAVAAKGEGYFEYEKYENLLGYGKLAAEQKIDEVRKLLR